MDVVVDIAVLLIPTLVTVDLARRARAGTRVPLAVWMIPGALGVDFVGLATSMRLDGIGGSPQAGEGPALAAGAIPEVAGRAEWLLYGIAVLWVVQALLAGLAGPDRSAPIHSRSSRVVAWTLASGGLVFGAGIWLLGSGEPLAGLREPLAWVSLGAVVAAGIGSVGSLRRRTPRSYPLVPAALAAGAVVVALAADGVGAIAAAAGTGVEGGGIWIPEGPELLVAAGACTGSGGAAWLAIRSARKPWKWGTVGDIMLFLFVALLFVSGIGGTLQVLEGRASDSANRPPAVPARESSLESHLELPHDRERGLCRVRTFHQVSVGMNRCRCSAARSDSSFSPHSSAWSRDRSPARWRRMAGKSNDRSTL